MRFIAKILCVSFAWLCGACAVPYTMETPASFRRFDDSRQFKMITADGVLLKARQVENYPKGDLDFWTDAMDRHLTERGYLRKSQSCFQTNIGKKACTLNFALPYGADDWIFSETLFVLEDVIVLVETAGPFERFAEIEDELAAALKTFDPHLD